MVIQANPYILPGHVALKRNGELVWTGPLSAPWDDVECDTVLVSEADYKALKEQTVIL